MQLKAAREALELETARDDVMKLKDGGVPPRVRPMGLRANHAWRAGGTNAQTRHFSIGGLAGPNGGNRNARADLSRKGREVGLGRPRMRKLQVWLRCTRFPPEQRALAFFSMEL